VHVGAQGCSGAGMGAGTSPARARPPSGGPRALTRPLANVKFKLRSRFWRRPGGPVQQLQCAGAHCRAVAAAAAGACSGRPGRGRACQSTCWPKRGRRAYLTAETSFFFHYFGSFLPTCSSFSVRVSANRYKESGWISTYPNAVRAVRLQRVQSSDMDRIRSTSLPSLLVRWVSADRQDLYDML
jgi:hypothetical protein